MKYLIILCLFTLNVSANIPNGVEVEPIVNFEHYHRKEPEPLGELRTIRTVGANFRYKIPGVALEGTYTKGTDTDNELADNKIETIREQVRLAIVGVFRDTKTVNVNLKIGVRAARNTTKTVTPTETTEEVGDIEIDPFVGTGLTIRFTKEFGISLNTMATKAEDSAGDEITEYATSVGTTIGFGK